MNFKEIKGLRPLTEFEGFVTKMCLIVLDSIVEFSNFTT